MPTLDRDDRLIALTSQLAEVVGQGAAQMAEFRATIVHLNEKVDRVLRVLDGDGGARSITERVALVERSNEDHTRTFAELREVNTWLSRGLIGLLITTVAALVSTFVLHK